MSKKKGAGKFVLGAALGAAIGFLFSPKSGKENRAMLKEKANELIDKAKEIDANDVKEAIEDKVTCLMKELKELDNEKVIEIAKKKAKQIKNQAEELASYAKEKATPIVADVADSLRTKAITVTENVLKKLEKEDK